MKHILDMHIETEVNADEFDGQMYIPAVDRKKEQWQK